MHHKHTTMTSNNQYYHDYNRFVSYQDLPDDVIAQMQEEEDADAVALSEHNARRAQDNEQSSINGESSSNEEELSNGSISSSSVLSELNLDRVVEEVFNDEVSDINLFTMGQFYDSVCRRMSVRALTNQMKEQIRQLLRTLLPPPDNDQSDNNSNNNDDARDCNVRGIKRCKRSEEETFTHHSLRQCTSSTTNLLTIPLEHKSLTRPFTSSDRYSFSGVIYNNFIPPFKAGFCNSDMICCCGVVEFRNTALIPIPFIAST